MPWCILGVMDPSVQVQIPMSQGQRDRWQINGKKYESENDVVVPHTTKAEVVPGTCSEFRLKAGLSLPRLGSSTRYQGHRILVHYELLAFITVIDKSNSGEVLEIGRQYSNIDYWKPCYLSLILQK